MFQYDHTSGNPDPTNSNDGSSNGTAGGPSTSINGGGGLTTESVVNPFDPCSSTAPSSSATTSMSNTSSGSLDPTTSDSTLLSGSGGAGFGSLSDALGMYNTTMANSDNTSQSMVGTPLPPMSQHQSSHHHRNHGGNMQPHSAFPSSTPTSHPLNSFKRDNEAIYNHPLFPLLALLFEKCELATSTPRDGTTGSSSYTSGLMNNVDVCSSQSFNDDIMEITKQVSCIVLPPVFPLLALLFEKCELATSTPRDGTTGSSSYTSGLMNNVDVCSSQSFNDDIMEITKQVSCIVLPPLFPLLALLFEKCELATSTPRDGTTGSSSYTSG